MGCHCGLEGLGLVGAEVYGRHMEEGEDRVESREKGIQNGRMELVWEYMLGVWEDVLLDDCELEAVEMVLQELLDAMKVGDHELQGWGWEGGQLEEEMEVELGGEEV